MTQEEQKREARENKFFTAVVLGFFLMIPTSVAGYAIIDWAKKNDVIKTAQQKTKEVKQKIISFSTEASKSNKR